MKTFVHTIKIPNYEFTVHEDEILKDFMVEPGVFIEFMKKGISMLSNSDNDIVAIELKKFIDVISKNRMTEILNIVLEFSKESGSNQQDVNEFISKLIEK